jgi:hypothetical protein
MAIQPKPLRFDYQAPTLRTGLTDVKGEIIVAGVNKAVGANALTFTEIVGTTTKGLYSLLITSAQLIAWGIVAGAENTVECYTNSATWPGPVPIKAVAQFATADDVISVLGSPAGLTLSADIQSVYSRLGAPASTSLAADIAALQALQAQASAQLTGLVNAADTGGAQVVQLNGIIPPTGSGNFPLQVPIVITDDTGANVAPSSINVTMVNAGGADRGQYITGSSGSPASLSPAPSSVGQYYVPISIPAGIAEEQWLLKTVFVYKGVTRTLFTVINVTADVAGVAQASALALVKADTASILTKLNDSMSGLGAIATAVGQTLAQATSAASAAANAYAQAQANQASLTTANSALVNIMGTNYSANTMSLAALAAAVAQIPTSGGRGV